MDDKKIFLPLLLYDDQCTLCMRFKQALANLPRGDKICMLSIREEWIYQKFPELSLKRCSESVHLVDENNKIHHGPEVISYLVQFYPGIQKFSWLLNTDMGKKAISVFYHAINEYRKSSLNHCKTCK